MSSHEDYTTNLSERTEGLDCLPNTVIVTVHKHLKNDLVFGDVGESNPDRWIEIIEILEFKWSTLKWLVDDEDALVS